jgi:hypothetical protein
MGAAAMKPRKVRSFGTLVLLLAVSSVAYGQQFIDFLEVSPFADGDNWFLTRPLTYELPGTTLRVEVPPGFVTDFASIPRPFWSLLPTWGKYGSPAVVHDYLYWDQRCTREQADWIFLLGMEESDVGSIERFVIHRAVRWGGAFAWRSNAQRRTDGWERVMPPARLPQSPNTTWEAHQAQLYEQGVRPEARPSPEPPPDYCQEAEALWRAFEQAH